MVHDVAAACSARFTEPRSKKAQQIILRWMVLSQSGYKMRQLEDKIFLIAAVYSSVNFLFNFLANYTWKLAVSETRVFDFRLHKVIFQ